MIPKYHYIFVNIEAALPKGSRIDYKWYYRDIGEHENAYDFYKWCRSQVTEQIEITAYIPKTSSKKMSILAFRYPIAYLQLASSRQIAKAIMDVWERLNV